MIAPCPSFEATIDPNGVAIQTACLLTLSPCQIRGSPRLAAAPTGNYVYHMARHLFTRLVHVYRECIKPGHLWATANELAEMFANNCGSISHNGHFVMHK